jgi:hypothetical protein
LVFDPESIGFQMKYRENMQEFIFPLFPPFF